MTMETAEQPKRGRRYRITPEIQADILRWLENGMSTRSTCKALGVGERTFFTECKRNPTFLAATDRARERGKAKLILKIAHEIRSAFEEIGIERLKPVSEFFHGRISLTTLRLVRCVIVAEAAA